METTPEGVSYDGESPRDHTPASTDTPSHAKSDGVRSAPVSSNLTGIAFAVEIQRIIKAKDADRWYNEEFVKLAAGESAFSLIAATKKLAAALGKDFKITEFQRLLKVAKQEMLDAAERPKSQHRGLIVSSNGDPKPLLANAIIKLKGSGLDIAYDAFSATIVHRKASPWGTTGPWSDRDDLEATNYLHHEQVGIKTTVARESAVYIAVRNEFHPVRDWLKSLKWDGTVRLPYLASRYFGADDSPYARGISQCWGISTVARIMRPGCIAKYMIVLEGHQDAGKSTGLRALTNGHLDGDRGVQWFRDSLPKIGSNNIGQYMQGVWLIEIAELAAIRGKEWDEVKQFISNPRDTFRVPYGHNIQDYPRQCVFAGSVNGNEWGGDPTGLVRFWPFQVGRIDIDMILKDREQIFAEAVSAFNEGMPWWDENLSALARVEQAKRYNVDVRREEVLGFAMEQATTTAGWCCARVIMKSLGIVAGQHDAHWKMRIGAILTMDGWAKGTHRFGNGPEQGFKKMDLFDSVDDGTDPR